MHREAYEYLRNIAGSMNLEGKHVVEIGSFDVNGTPRRHFASAASYTGVDARPGRGVDVVKKAQSLRAGEFGHDVDVVVCAETLEHDADPKSIIAAAHRILKPGGVLIITAAGLGRVPHGVDGGAVDRGEHYANIGPDDLYAWLSDWENVTIERNDVAHDIYAVAVKPEAEEKAPLRSEPATKKD